ncbi:MAG: hypothetical protein MZU84_04545 [Sphingobacterium sp.]|nr:hypothetical protein [Sphingobacterium sp.]
MLVGMHHPFARPVEADGDGPRHRAGGAAEARVARTGEAVASGRTRPGVVPRGPASHRPRAGGSAGAGGRAASMRWPFSSQVYLGGIRPNGLRWIAINEPGWFAGEGWHLTPETAGVARADGAGLGRGPIRAWIRPPRRRGDDDGRRAPPRKRLGPRGA